MSLHSTFHTKCGGLPINFSLIIPACIVDGEKLRKLHSHFRIRRNLNGYTIIKFDGSRTPDGKVEFVYQVPYENVNEKLLHLSHLLSIGSHQDLYRQGVLQEEYPTLLNDAESKVRKDIDVVTNRDDESDFGLCSCCGCAPASDFIATAEESGELRGGQEAVLRIFHFCGLTNNQNFASLNRVGEFIYSFFCYFSGGLQHLEEACTYSASRLILLCADCYGSRETPASKEICRGTMGAAVQAKEG